MTNNEQAISVHEVHTDEHLRDASAFAGKLAKVQMLPPDFQGNVGNCFLAIEYAGILKLPFLSVMLAMFIPRKGGKPGFSAEFYLSRLKTSLKIVGTVEYEVVNLSEKDLLPGVPDIAVRATVIDRETKKGVAWL